jgi:membrane-bound lytic murein transglycosylase B
MMRGWMAVFGLMVVLVPGCGFSGPVDRSERPAARREARVTPVPPRLRPEPAPEPEPEPAHEPAPSRTPAFERWLADFRPRARAAGITPATFDRAFRNATYLPDVIARDRNQAEFNRTIWDYLDSAVSDTRIANGRQAMAEHARVLDAIEARYGVDKAVVVAIWGMESAYGTRRGDTPLISALATLAEDGRRGRFFEEQLIAALKILQNGDTTPEAMTGSWAGAMGHTQFIPTSYLAYAADFGGDGRRDIWSDDPTDALASTANYLARSGWKTGQPWGIEVILPAGFNYAQAGKSNRRDVSDWARAGVRAASGARLPDAGAAAILVPAGANGPALMIFDNFRAISRYNAADSYVIGVGHLADRIRGAGPFRTAWPRDGRAMTSAERRELQERLTRAGFDTQGIDGRIGPDTIAAIRNWQRANGHVPDGYASIDILRTLR